MTSVLPDMSYIYNGKLFKDCKKKKYIYIYNRIYGSLCGVITLAICTLHMQYKDHATLECGYIITDHVRISNKL